MVGGVPRYYQFAACFRDEDPRADRLYGEFYQLDLEMAFVENGEEVRTLMDPAIKDLVTNFAGKILLSEDIPRIPYREAMETYGSDKPDLRFDMKLVDLTEVFVDSGFDRRQIVMKREGNAVVATPDIEGLVAEIRHHHIDLLVIDPFVPSPARSQMAPPRVP